MPRNPPDPDTVRIALEFVSTGMSHDDVAAEMGLSASTIGSWVKRYGGGKVISRTVAPAAKARAEARAAEPEPSDEPDADPAEAGDDDLVASLLRLQKEMHDEARASKRLGNMTAAQRGLKAVADLAPLIARLKRAAKDDRDVLRVSRSEIDRAHADHRERLHKLLDRPLLCAKCGRELSVEWGHGKDSDDEHS